MLGKVQTRYWPVASCSYDGLVAEMGSWIDAFRAGTVRKARLVCFCDGNGMSAAYRKDLKLRAIYREADAVCADGKATEWLARISGRKLPERVIGPKTFPKAMAAGLTKGWRHFFYGAREGVADELAKRMRETYPGVEIVGTYSPPFGEICVEEWTKVREMIRAAKADVLWVSLGCPKQEKWCAAHLEDLDVGVLMPVGAVFDFFAGSVPDIPEWVHKMGLCWFWRLLTGGKRVFVRNVKCVSAAFWVLGKEWVRIKVLRRNVDASHESL